MNYEFVNLCWMGIGMILFGYIVILLLLISLWRNNIDAIGYGLPLTCMIIYSIWKSMDESANLMCSSKIW